MIIGTKVLVTNLIVKDRQFVPRDTTDYKIVPCAPVEGYYMGYRFRTKGHTINYGKDGRVFRGNGSVKHLLVVTSERTNPIFADPATTIPV